MVPSRSPLRYDERVIEKRWVRAEVDETTAAALQRDARLDPRTARLLVARGVTSAEQAEAFLHPRLGELPDPSTLADLDKAAERIADALAAGDRIALYGDYDVDGVTSTALLASFLRSEGADPRLYIPKRLTEGYGLNGDAVDVLAAEGIQLLVTLDCGITASREIARANAHGIDCIVVDHHRCPPELPEAFATLNPQRADCGYPDKGLAAVGVCFTLLCGLRRVLRDRGWYGQPGRTEPNLRRYLDLVALGTIADMVPLSGVNRTLAWYGVEELKAGRRPGLRALMDVSRIRAARCSSSDVGFRLGPRINAAGRLSDATVGVRLLLAEDMAEARPLAETLDVANGQRQQIESDVFRGALAQVEAFGEALPPAFVLYDDSWHPGVVGIVASKIVERFDRPTIIIGEGGRGSCRTARNVHLYDAIRDVSDHLQKFGGHRAAAGLTIEASRIDAFRADFVARVEADDGSGDDAPTLTYDDELEPSLFRREFAESLMRLQPFGNGNPEPLFMTRGVHVRSARVVGKDHLKLRVAEGGPAGVDAIAFKRADLLDQLPAGQSIELAYHLELSEFNGLESLELRIRDLRPL